MATASPSAVLHDNSRRSLSLQVAQKNNSVHPSFDTAADTITLVLNAGRSRSRRSGAFQVSQGSAATNLR